MKKPGPKFRSKSWNNLSILKSIPIIWMIVFRNLVIGWKRLTSLTRSKLTTVLLIMTPMLKGLLMCNLRLNVFNGLGVDSLFDEWWPWNTIEKNTLLVSRLLSWDLFYKEFPLSKYNIVCAKLRFFFPVSFSFLANRFQQQFGKVFM